MAKISIQRSVEYQLNQMTQEDVDRYLEIVKEYQELPDMDPAEFKEWFEDYSEEGLAQLLFVRMEEGLAEA